MLHEPLLLRGDAMLPVADLLGAAWEPVNGDWSGVDRTDGDWDRKAEE